MEVFSSSTNASSQTTEIYFKRILPGSISDVRTRLVPSMESLGYDIIEEEPNIIGRRGARSWAAWFASADVLEYPMSLTVRLKAVSNGSTRVTFDYVVKHPMLNAGEKEIVVQEARTIAAISKTQAVEKLCPVCETETTDDSRFCRKCGAPLTTESAELEVLRMMAETRAGKTSVVAASLGSLTGTLIVFFAVVLNTAALIRPEVFVTFLMIGGSVLLFSIISSFFGWNRITRALKKPDKEINITHEKLRELPPLVDVPRLSEIRKPASVTEGTTNLLNNDFARNDEREKVPVERKHETNELS